MSTDNRLWVLYLSVGIDILGVGIVIPLLPYYTTALGGDPWIFGLLVTLYGIMQLIGSPIMGKISDTYGRKKALLISLVGSGLGYFTLGFANSLFILFLSRIPVGLVKQTMSASKAYITDVSEPSMRAKNFGIVATAAGIGFIIGPTLGGIISAYNSRLPPFIATFLFVIDFFFVYFMLPESTPHVPETVKQASSFSLASISQVFKREKVATLLFAHVLIQFSNQLFRSNFPLYIQTRFNADPKQNGFILSYCSLLEVATQSLGVRLLSKRFTDNQLILGAVSVSSLSFAALAFSYDMTLFLVALAPITFATATLGTCIASALTKLVDSKDIGVNLGVFDSFEGLSRVLSPSVGGVVMESMGAPGVPLTSAALFGALSMFIMFNFDLKRKSE